MLAVDGNPIEVNNQSPLESLDDFSLMGIFDELNLVDLLKIASLNPRFKEIISDHYIVAKYGLDKSRIYITVASTVIVGYEDDKNSSPTFAFTYEQALSALENFGGSFINLRIVIQPSGYQYVPQIQAHINKYCSTASQELTFYREDTAAAADMNVSFGNVTNVTLHHIGSINPMQLDVAFPQMQELTIGRQADLTNHYPNLWAISFPKSYGYSDITSLSKFAKLNPQLRKLDSAIFNCDTYLTSISEMLPNLEILSLTTFPTKQYTINSLPIARFKHVKQFTLEIDNSCGFINLVGNSLRQLLESIQFDQLQSFTMQSVRRDLLDFLIELIVRNTALHSIEIRAELSFAQLSALITPLPQLKDLSVILKHPPERGPIRRLLELVIASNHALETFTIRIDEDSWMSYRDVLTFVPPGWSFDNAMAAQNPQLVELKRTA